MTGAVSHRTASLAALAAAAGLIWSTAPAWACGPSMGGGAPSGGGEGHQGPDSSGYNGAAAEGARQGAADAAAGLDNSGEAGPARASPDTAQDHSAQIAAIGAEEAADNAGECSILQMELAVLLANLRAQRVQDGDGHIPDWGPRMQRLDQMRGRRTDDIREMQSQIADLGCK
jgi:hypothetical protein